MTPKTITRICANESIKKVADIRKMRRLYRAAKSLIINNQAKADAENTRKDIKQMDSYIKFDSKLIRIARKYRVQLSLAMN